MRGYGRSHYVLCQAVTVYALNGLPRTHLSGGDCSASVADPNVNSYTQTKPPLVPTHRVGKERSAEHNKKCISQNKLKFQKSTTKVSITKHNSIHHVQMTTSNTYYKDVLNAQSYAHQNQLNAVTTEKWPTVLIKTQTNMTQ